MQLFISHSVILSTYQQILFIGHVELTITPQNSIYKSRDFIKLIDLNRDRSLC